MTVADVWDLYGQLSARDSSSLSEAQRQLVAVCDLRQEVNAGGFDNYFRAWGGNSARHALNGLPVMLGTEWADLLGEAIALLGRPYPTDPDERAGRLDRSDLNEALTRLDERFYALEESDDADARLNELVASNPGLAS